MAIRALVTGKRVTLTHPSEADLPQDQRVRFVFQALSSRAQAHIRDACVDVNLIPDPDNPGEQKAQVVTKNGLSMLMTAQMGLADIENLFFEDEKGELTPFKVELDVINLGGGAKWTCVKQSALDALPDTIRSWCAKQAQELHAVKEEELKNSEE